jgi:hypothetical protein
MVRNSSIPTYMFYTDPATEIPQYVPGAAYRQLEFLLGRIDNLSAPGSYTA